MSGAQLPIESIRQARVLVVGDIMLDEYWFSSVERISPEAPVPIALVKKKTLRPGGAANVACNVAALGANATLLGVVGQDQYGAELASMLNERGIRNETIKRDDYETIVKLRVLSKNQQLLRVDFEKKLQITQLSELSAAFNHLVKEHDIIIFSDYAKGALQHIAQFIQIAKTQGVFTLVDPKGDDYTPYKNADLMTPNKSEFRQVAGVWGSELEMTNLAQSCVKQWGVGALLVTRSEEGMSLYTCDDSKHQASFAQEVFDVSGAGDTVIATLGVLIAAGMPLDIAMTWANAAAGVVVKKIGTDVCYQSELADAAPTF